MTDYALSNLREKDSIDHKTIARQGIKLNRNVNDGSQVSPAGDKPFLIKLRPHLLFISVYSLPGKRNLFKSIFLLSLMPCRAKIKSIPWS